MRRTLALSALALMVVAGNAFGLGEARVQGKITDAVTHKPIPNVVITVDATTGHSVHNEFKADKDGVYRFLILAGTLMCVPNFLVLVFVPEVRSVRRRDAEPRPALSAL